MSNGNDKKNLDPEWREWTDLDRLHGELIAREADKALADSEEHYRRAHERTMFDPVTDFLFGSEREECDDPCCSIPRDEAERPEPESWWERWFRGRGSPDGNDGESGSSD